MHEEQSHPTSPADARSERRQEKTPPAGPHDKESLIDRDKTPGTGSLPEKGEPEADVGPD